VPDDRRFAVEYQGKEGQPEGAEFPPEWFEDQPGRPFWFRDWPESLVYRVVANDPSKGRTDKSIPYLEKRLRDSRITVPPR